MRALAAMAGIWLLAVSAGAVVIEPLFLAVAVALGVALVIAMARFMLADAVSLRRLKARRVGGDEIPRVANLTDGLAASLGLETPSLYLLPGGPPNAAVAWVGGSAIVLTEHSLDGLTRTELEALLAHCLVRLADPKARRAARVASAVGFPFSSLIGRTVTAGDDVRAAALTRYPPGLARALEKAGQGDALLGPQWFAGEDRFHESTSKRVEAVLDL